MRYLLAILLATFFAFSTKAQDFPKIDVIPVLETVESVGDGAAGVAVWLHPDDLVQSVILGADDNAGLGVYALDGTMLHFYDTEPVAAVDVRYNTSGAGTSLIVASVKDEPRYNVYTIDPTTKELTVIFTGETSFPLQALCLYQSPLTNTTFAIVINERGTLEQYALIEDDGEWSATLARSVDVGSEVEGCAVDDNLRRLYISEGNNAVWRYGAEAEDGINRSIVDLVGERGHITEELEGVAVYAVGENEGYLLVSNEKNDTINVYERTGDNAFVGAFELVASDSVDATSEPTGMAVVNLPLGDAFPEGLFITADDVNSLPNANNNYKIVSWADVVSGLNLTADTAFDPRQTSETATSASSATVTAVLETEPVAANTDAADDPAIWINPADATQSTIIGTDKRNGLVVFGLDGKLIQTINIGRVNNVDVRDGFMLNGEAVSLVGATNRTEGSMVLYAVNAETRELYDVAAQLIISNVEEVYGFCLYVSPVNGAYYAFINSADTGEVEQYLLTATDDGKVTAEVVRTFVVGSQTEGCVVDDETSTLYIGEEAVGLWKLGAEPDASNELISVDKVTTQGGNITADTEGVAIYKNTDGTGYLVVSSQGSDEYAVYERQGNNAFIGLFRVVESATIDGTSETDGLDVTSVALGDQFPNGMLVVQDDLNLNPRAPQNFKLIDWRDVMAALGQ